jgi:hypothetical protein
LQPSQWTLLSHTHAKDFEAIRGNRRVPSIRAPRRDSVSRAPIRNSLFRIFVGEFERFWPDLKTSLHLRGCKTYRSAKPTFPLASVVLCLQRGRIDSRHIALVDKTRGPFRILVTVSAGCAPLSFARPREIAPPHQCELPRNKKSSPTKAGLPKIYK